MQAKAHDLEMPRSFMQLQAPNPNFPTFCHDDLPFNWLMTRWEKYAFSSLLSWLKPEVAIEIGTYQGGSLQVIASHAKKVYSIDVIDAPGRSLATQMPNVRFLVGDSKRLIPELLAELADRNEDLGFVLIDGDHSTEGVKADITALLSWVPRTPVFILMHDSFHPPCRQGMLESSWASSLYVHYVELDFVPGVFFREGNSAVAPGSMYGGFALAMLLPEKRQDVLRLGETQRGLYEATLEKSRYGKEPPMQARHGILASFRKRMGLRTRIRRMLRMPSRQ
jgi:hypothetical protein